MQEATTMNGSVSVEDIFRVVAPLDPILSDSGVWEVMIDGFERVLVERSGKLEQVESPFQSVEELQALIDGLFGLYGITLNASNPVGYISLPDHSRIMAVVPPNAVNGPYMVIRRVVGPRVVTWEKLIEWGSVPQEAYDLLKSAVAARLNILVSGGTGSGKTTIANRVAEMVPPEERLIVVEQSYEMQVVHPRTIRLEAGGPARLAFEDVLTAATRMRPDRLIVGNLDGPIAASVLHYFGQGYDGSLANIHATSVEDALTRLEAFCLMANLGLGLGEIRQMIASGLQLIIQQERLPDGRRKIVEIAELRGIDNHRYVLQPLMHYVRQTDRFEMTGAKPGWEK
jgi:pilus assembly protein CpaF